jgi:hypothetical protein
MRCPFRRGLRPADRTVDRTGAVKICWRVVPWRIRTEIVARAVTTRIATKKAWKDRPAPGARRVARQAARRLEAEARATRAGTADPADPAARAAVERVALTDRTVATPRPRAWATKNNSRIVAEIAIRASRASPGSRARSKARTPAADQAGGTPARRQAARTDPTKARAFCQEHLSTGRPSGRPFC